MLFGLFKPLKSKDSPSAQVLSGRILPILGVERQVVIQNDIKKGITITDKQIIVTDPRQNFSKALEEGLKHHIRKIFETLCLVYAQQLGVKVNKISIRDTRSRWGSCSSRGNLSFSWRLIFAPYPVVVYLAAHEVAHLIHMNHSRAFWQTVATIDPGYLSARQWLRQQGHALLKINI